METYLIPCLLGLEKLVSDEVKRLGLQEVQAENGRILCRGTLADASRSCFRGPVPLRGRTICRRTPPSR